MIKKIKVETYLTRLYCYKCGEEMAQGDTVLTTYPQQYSYHCPKCNSVITDTKDYPYTTFKEVKDEQIKNKDSLLNQTIFYRQKG